MPKFEGSVWEVRVENVNDPFFISFGLLKAGVPGSICCQELKPQISGHHPNDKHEDVAVQF